MSRPVITCKARSKQSGRRCRRAPVPFTYEAGVPLCAIHGGWSPSVLDKANAAFETYVRLGAEEWEPAWMRAEKIKAKLRSDGRRAARALKRQERDLKVAGRSSPASADAPLRYEGIEDADAWLRSNFWTNG